MCKPIDGRIHIASLPSRARLNMDVDADEFLIRLYRGRSRKYPQNDTNNLKSRLVNLKINSDVPNSVIDDLVDELRITLKCGGNPSGVQQKLEVLEHIKFCKGLREYAKKRYFLEHSRSGFCVQLQGAPE